MDEETFRSGKHPDGTPVAHGTPAEYDALRSFLAEVTARGSEIKAQLEMHKEIVKTFDRQNAALHRRVEQLQEENIKLEAKITMMARHHDARVTDLLAANNHEVERRRAAERAVEHCERIIKLISKEKP